MTQQERKLPIGLQSFVNIRRDGYVYVDKTDIVWHLVNGTKKYCYLSRPRRFGKSILVDTLECYLSGRKDLFEGLKIMDLETEWKNYPVVRLDLSQGGATAEELKSYLNKAFKKYEKLYGIIPDASDSLTMRLDEIIRTANEKTGLQVAILIDEYDAPLQHSWRTPEHENCTAVYRSVFSVLKTDDEYEKFVFVTGITKFTQISLFSVLNNLCNISFSPQYAPLCGITEQEMLDNFQPEIQQLADHNGWTFSEAQQRLKERYDGYHFSEENMVDIYNPFSLIYALSDKRLGNYWAMSGATSLLPKFVDNMEIRLRDFDNCPMESFVLETSDVTGGGAELFLYQSGYLTIKNYDEFGYILGFPNTEVRQALYATVLPALAMREREYVVSIQANFFRQFGMGNLPEAMKCLKSLIADVPYSNKKLQSMDMEERYRLIISTIMNALGYRVEVERMHSGGRIDIVVWTSRFVYVMELKLTKNGGLAAAAEQIRKNGYGEPFKADQRKTVCLAIELNDMGKGLVDWQTVE
jgi:hypothetical protein